MKRRRDEPWHVTNGCIGSACEYVKQFLLIRWLDRQRGHDASGRQSRKARLVGDPQDLLTLQRAQRMSWHGTHRSWSAVSILQTSVGSCEQILGPVRHDLPASASSFAERPNFLRQHLPEHRGSAGADFCRSGRLASSFACKPDSVRREFGPMRHDLADSASTFAEPANQSLEPWEQLTQPPAGPGAQLRIINIMLN
jgi:hypothetical protein